MYVYLLCVWLVFVVMVWRRHIRACLTHNHLSPDHPYLDAKITGWNLRDKKLAVSPMTYIRKDFFNFSGDKKKNFVEIYKQSRYKYLVYVDGHCAACR
ncbi:hypothetical protein EON63_18945 [archaeon]|nr:MAG: hypothetical protein EON63_18945 [archaeon]